MRGGTIQPIERRTVTIGIRVECRTRMLENLYQILEASGGRVVCSSVQPADQQ